MKNPTALTTEYLIIPRDPKAEARAAYHARMAAIAARLGGVWVAR